MKDAALARRAEELAAQGAAYVTATVVRAGRPTSARAGDVALVTSDGKIQGFVGGICAEHSVRLFAWSAMEAGEPLLLRILPKPVVEGGQSKQEDGAVTVVNTCLSGGAIEVFLEPTLPCPRVNVVGSKPIASELVRMGPQFDLDVVAVGDEAPDVREGDLAMVVAAHGKGELEALRAGLEADLPYVGLVSSPKRGSALVDELRELGVAEDRIARMDNPAGLDIGARTPAEIALSIFAAVVQARYGGAYKPLLRAPSDEAPPEFAVDPICGMTVTAQPSTLHVEHDGETVYFCAPACKRAYEAQHVGVGDAPPTGRPKPAPATAVDPICGMTVLARPETLHVEHEGATVYFCREACKAQFEKEHHAVAAT